MLCTKNSSKLILIKKMDHVLFEDLSKPELLKVSAKMQPLSPVYSKTCCWNQILIIEVKQAFFEAKPSPSQLKAPSVSTIKECNDALKRIFDAFSTYREGTITIHFGFCED